MKRLISRNHVSAQQLYLIAGSCCCFLLAVAVLLYQQYMSIAQAAKPIYVAEYDTVAIPVPAMQVAAGVRTEKIVLEEVPYPRHQLPQDVVMDIQELSGLETSTILPARLPLFKSNFVTSGSSQNPVIESIPSGMRAITVKVDATSSVEGWAGSGSIVDVLLIEKNQTVVIAEGVRILSSERSVAPVDGQVSPNVPSTVTLLVSQDQCLKINTAIPRGRIAFALRSYSDQDSWQRTVFTAESLLNKEPVINADIKGFLQIKDLGAKGNFAFIDGKWIATEIEPEIFSLIN